MREQLVIPAGADGMVWEHVPHGRLHPRHHHDEVEFNLVIRGTSHYLLDDRRYDLGPGSLVWLFPEQEHILVDMSPDLCLWIGVLRPQVLRQANPSGHYQILTKANPVGAFCRRLPDADTQRLTRLCRGLDAAQTDLPQFNVGLHYLFLSAWSAFHHASDMIVSTRLHPAVERAANLMGDGTNDDQALDKLSLRAGLSYSRLSRLFQTQMGMSMVGYRNRRRIERFLELYGSGQRITMLAAALKAGFGSYPQFHRVFRQVMGLSPSHWRKQGGESI